jgi:hypothetical protein
LVSGILNQGIGFKHVFDIDCELGTIELLFMAAVVSAATKTNMLTGMSNDHENSRQLFCVCAVARRDVKKDISFSTKHGDGVGDRHGCVLVNHRTVTVTGHDQREQRCGLDFSRSGAGSWREQ